MLNKSLIIKHLILKLSLLLAFIGLMFGCYFYGRIKTIEKIGRAAFTESETVEVSSSWSNPYAGLIADERAYYICHWCSVFGVPANYAVSKLLVENPEDDPMALSRPNRNGSFDVGYFQLNSRYVYTEFKDKYWDFDKLPKGQAIEFDPMNWQHNTYVAIRLMSDLIDCFGGDLEKAAAAYNCGASRTLSGDIPRDTQVYVAKVMNYYKLLDQS